LWAHLESEESGVSRLLLLSVVVADTEFVIIVLWKKRDLERRKVLQRSFFFQGLEIRNHG